MPNSESTTPTPRVQRAIGPIAVLKEVKNVVTAVSMVEGSPISTDENIVLVLWINGLLPYIYYTTRMRMSRESTIHGDKNKRKYTCDHENN